MDTLKAKRPKRRVDELNSIVRLVRILIAWMTKRMSTTEIINICFGVAKKLEEIVRNNRGRIKIVAGYIYLDISISIAQDI